MRCRRSSMTARAGGATGSARCAAASGRRPGRGAAGVRPVHRAGGGHGAGIQPVLPARRQYPAGRAGQCLPARCRGAGDPGPAGGLRCGQDREQPRDDLLEIWAQTPPPYALDEGGWMAGCLRDLQGRFNLNSLAARVPRTTKRRPGGQPRFTAGPGPVYPTAAGAGGAPAQ